MALYDLVIKGGRLLDPAIGLDEPRDVALAKGVVATVAEEIPAWQADAVLDAHGQLVVPGMIDLHVHFFEGVSHYGIAPDPTCLARGVTTALDAGSSGADTFLGFRNYVIERSGTRIYALLNISSQGMLCPRLGELDDPRWADIPSALRMIEQHRDVIIGVKVRLTRGQVTSEQTGIRPLYQAVELAAATGLPLMVHPQEAWCDSLDDILAALRPGDILTHCFHGKSHGMLDEQGHVRDAVWDARQRGVLIDVGHGAGSFTWRVAEAALAQGLLPTTISSDLHTGSVHGPVYDLLTTMAKFVVLGLSLDDALARVTSVPARVLGQEGILGTLQPGANADALVLSLEGGEFPLVDCEQQVRTGRLRLEPEAVVRAGRLVARNGVLI